MGEHGPIRPFIMCGGSGSRLWPISRASMPKQFQSFVGARTLLQEAVLRVAGPGFAPPALVAAEAYRFIVEEQVGALGQPRGTLVLEPVARNTAAVALVAALVAEAGGDALVLLMPSDHVIRDPDAFRELVLVAAPAAWAGRICLFGIAPDRPETGYGYIEVGDEPVPVPDSPVRSVARFLEKPDLETARRLATDPRYAWNAGIFLFAPDTLLREAEERRPDLLAGARRAVERGTTVRDVLLLEAAAVEGLEAISLDRALIEGSARTAVLRADLAWSDLGAWDAIATAHEPDRDGNVLLGRAVAIDTTGSLIRTGNQLVATLGLRDVVVVASDDAVLVADAARAQEVKPLVDALRAMGLAEADSHTEVHRPWGSYRSVVSGEGFQVKLIRVKPGGRLSLQLHRHRAEHWVVVKGEARITCGQRVFTLHENQSTFIPQGERHRLENAGEAMLEMVEVQSGSYLGEDDIERFDDAYGRTTSLVVQDRFESSNG